MADDEQGLQPTPVRTIVWSVLLGAALTYLGLTLVAAFEFVTPELSWATPILLAVAAAGAAVLARVTWLRNHVLKRPAEPKLSVATLAVAKALLLGGSLLVGGYAAFAIYHLPHLDVPAQRQRVLMGIASLASSVALVVAGWFVERACRAPLPPSDDENETS